MSKSSDSLGKQNKKLRNECINVYQRLILTDLNADREILDSIYNGDLTNCNNQGLSIFMEDENNGKIAYWNYLASKGMMCDDTIGYNKNFEFSG